MPQPHPGQEWKHGWIPITPAAAASKNHGKKPGANSLISRIVAEAAAVHKQTQGRHQTPNGDFKPAAKLPLTPAERRAAAADAARKAAEGGGKQGLKETPSKPADTRAGKRSARVTSSTDAASAGKKPQRKSTRLGKKVGVDSRNAPLREGDEVTVRGNNGKVVGKGNYGAIRVEVDGQEQEVSPMDVRSKLAAEVSRKADDAIRSATGRQAARTEEKLGKIYGDRLRIQKGSHMGPQHAAEFEKIPEPFHDVMAKHVHGIDLGDGPVSDYMPELRGVHPRGWPADKSWDNVAGVYDGNVRRVVVGGGPGLDHGSTSVAVHEAGHALDHALGDASSSQKFRAVYADALEQGLSPYYAQSGAGGRQEMWAEAFAAWTQHLNDHPDQRNSRIGAAIGVPHKTAAETGGRLASYFSNLLSELAP